MGDVGRRTAHRGQNDLLETVEGLDGQAADFGDPRHVAGDVGGPEMGLRGKHDQVRGIDDLRLPPARRAEPLPHRRIVDHEEAVGLQAVGGSAISIAGSRVCQSSAEIFRAGSNFFVA